MVNLAELTLPSGCHSRHATVSVPRRVTLSAVFGRHLSALRRADHRSGVRGAIGLVALTSVALTACNSDDAGSAERFCGEIAAHKDELTAPDLEYSEDIAPVLDRYRSIGDLAPLSIEKEWNELVSAYETADTIVVGDADSEQAAVAAIYSAEASAAKVDSWLKANCAVDIGPVVTLVPHGP